MLPTILDKKIILQNDNIAFAEYAIQLEDGSVLHKPIVEHPGAVAIVPILDDGRIVLVRQYRLAADRYVLELPAGTREPDEDPHTCAERELQEEAGYFPAKLTLLGGFYVAPGMIQEYIHLFLAENLRPSSLPADADEAIEVVPQTLEEALAGIASGAIQDAKTIIGLLMLARR